MNVIPRDHYLNQLIAGQGNGLIKIITGIRRCGKSFLLFELFNQHLLSHGIEESHIIKLALDDLLNAEYRDPLTLLHHIRSQMTDSSTYYILLDEVQMVADFEGVLNSLLHVGNADVYVTGSNSRFLASDIATEFRGRGDEIRIRPLSFAEFLSAYRGGDKYDAWRDYFTYGGLPHILALDSEQKKATYLRNLYRTVYKTDLVERNRIKKSDELDTLVKILASSIGAPCNPTKLANTFRSVAHSQLNAETIGIYLNHLQDAFLIEKSTRFDIKGKRYIGALPKYYFADTGLRNALLDFRQNEESHLMENVIYNELRSRGFLVDVGMVEVRTPKQADGSSRHQLEVDFVANLGSRRYYVQSALSIPDSQKMAQESASLDNIPDSFKKIIITKDNVLPWHNEKGTLILSLFDFLLNPVSIDF